MCQPLQRFPIEGLRRRMSAFLGARPMHRMQIRLMAPLDHKVLEVGIIAKQQRSGGDRSHRILCGHASLVCGAPDPHAYWSSSLLCILGVIGAVTEAGSAADGASSSSILGAGSAKSISQAKPPGNLITRTDYPCYRRFGSITDKSVILSLTIHPPTASNLPHIAECSAHRLKATTRREGRQP